MKRLTTDTGASRLPVEVMHVITSLDVGGAETILTRLVTGDREEAVSHTVVSLKPGGALRASLEAAGTPVLDLGIGRKLSALSGLARLTKVIKTTQPDVVHSWLYHADLLATLALALSGRRASTRLVWGIRCSDMDMRRYARSNRYILKMLASLSSRTDLVLCNSNAGRVAHEHLGYRPPQWRVIPNGLDLERFASRPDERAAVRSELGLEEASFVVGMCARVDPKKDHATFVKAAAMFAETAPGARFVLIGAGTDEPGSPLDGCIAASGIAARLVRLGLRQDICRLHAALDIATLSSAFGEGFPNALAEAMACGVPCVATSVGDSATIVGDTGLIVPPHDAAALAAAWERLRNEGHDGRAARGAAARHRIENRYALATMIAAYRGLYSELARGPQSAGARDAYPLPR